MRQFKNNQSIAGREIGYAAYLNDIRHLSLTAEEEIETATKAANGDEHARERLITANLLFVVSVAKQYNPYRGCLTLLDLVQAGSMGIIDAANTYDVTRGFKFTSHAVAYIRKHIILCLNANSRIVRDYRGENPNLHASLDAPAYGDDSENKTLADVMCVSTDKESKDSLHTDIERVMDALLTDREKSIVCGIFGIGCKAKAKYEISISLGISEERVRQILAESINKMKDNRRAFDLLRQYF